MVNVPLRGADMFLKSSDIDEGDLATIIKEPYIQAADKTRFGKERTVISVQLCKDRRVYRWGLNTTRNDKLVLAFGADGGQWVGKQVRIKISEMNVSGVQKSVLYAVPVVQVKVAPAESVIGE